MTKIGTVGYRMSPGVYVTDVEEHRRSGDVSVNGSIRADDVIANDMNLGHSIVLLEAMVSKLSKQVGALLHQEEMAKKYPELAAARLQYLKVEHKYETLERMKNDVTD